jgi:hypothetical protein
MITTLIILAVLAFLVSFAGPIPYEAGEWYEVFTVFIPVFVLLCVIVLPAQQLVIWYLHK